MPLIPVIISGGAGSRLWPVSKAGETKPFMHAGNGGSLLQQAFLRAAALPDVAEILTVTGHDVWARTMDAYRPVNTLGQKTSFILEPAGRNTAAAVAVAALRCRRSHGENSVMLVLPADHLIDDQQAFADAVGHAVAKAQQGGLVVLGIEPTSAHTGYGYVDVSASPARFVEKPQLDMAEAFFRSGHHLWNSGISCFTPETLLREMKEHCPDILDAASRCLEVSPVQELEGSLCVALDHDSFSNVPKNSIDAAVMEKSSSIAVVPCRFGWRDIGSWASVAGLAHRDANGNTGDGNVQFHQSSNCYVHGNGRMVAVVGLQNIVIIDTPDGLLVSHRDKTEEVKHIASS